MGFSLIDLKKIAHLARLSWREEELESLQEDMERIVAMVNKLSEVPVEGVKAMSHAGDRILDLREDQVQSVLGRRCVESSQGFEEGLIRVPKIIE
jgi:aspartyl-tRNA(Asn)/glutamyl-tRNA(Gln) amidotransferase subunit C